MFLPLVLAMISISAQAAELCFLAQENDKIVKQIGQCNKRYSPFSTFKIPLAVMGFDAGILQSPEMPIVNFTPEIEKNYVTYYNPQKYPTMLLWKRPQTPQSWMHYSIVWFSRYITHKLGIKTFQGYVNKFHYGNQNIAGRKGNEGLMNSWIDHSLEISPIEPVHFMTRLAEKTLPVTTFAQEKTIQIIKMETMLDDWQLYGKTGGSKEFGWFVGWIEKGQRRIHFAQVIGQKENDSLISGGLVAKEVAKNNLISIVLKQN